MVEYRVLGIFSILKLHRFLEIAMSNKTGFYMRATLALNGLMKKLQMKSKRYLNNISI